MEINELKSKLERRLLRLNKRKEELEASHRGREGSHFTYWGGWDMGYIKATTNEIENMIDELDSLTTAST
jgi:hypothetical protein